MYIKENINPKKRKVGDCSTRALAKVLDILYNDALKEQYEAACETSYGITDSDLMDVILVKYGFTKISMGRLKKGEKRPTVADVAKLTSTGKRAVCNVASHYVACRDGNSYDIWDSSTKSCYNYWIK